MCDQTLGIYIEDIPPWAERLAGWHQACLARDQEAEEAHQVLAACARARGMRALQQQGWRLVVQQHHMITSWLTARERMKRQREVEAYRLSLYRV